MMWLLGALGFVRKAAQAAFGFVTRNPLLAALIVSLVACAWLYRGKVHETHRADEAVAGRIADRRAYAAAQEAAAAAQIAANHAVEATYSAKAKDADHAYQIALNDARSASGRYADSHGVRAVCAPGSAGGSASATVLVPTADSDGLGADAVVVSRADFDTLNANTVRLDQVRLWSDGLIAAGLAVKSE